MCVCVCVWRGLGNSPEKQSSVWEFRVAGCGHLSGHSISTFASAVSMIGEGRQDEERSTGS